MLKFPVVHLLSEALCLSHDADAVRKKKKGTSGNLLVPLIQLYENLSWPSMTHRPLLLPVHCTDSDAQQNAHSTGL